MTTAKSLPTYKLPDTPFVPDEKMTLFDHLTINGGAHFLAQYLGNLATTLIGGDRYLMTVLPAELPSMAGVPYPDMLVAFDADPAAFRARNGYVISEQGKPPDFVLEVASASTGRRDAVDKRLIYAALGIPEYWRFDETGEFHGARLAGDRLVGDRYEPIPIEELPDGSVRGYSAMLNVELRWVAGQLIWYNPTTGEPIETFESLRQSFAEEREARIRAEARVRELQEQIRRLQGE